MAVFFRVTYYEPIIYMGYSLIFDPLRCQFGILQSVLVFGFFFGRFVKEMVPAFFFGQYFAFVV